MRLLSRILLSISAIVFAFGAYIHTSAFGRMSEAVAKSDLLPFFGNGFRTLWLMDSTVQIALALVFAMVAIKPNAATRPIVILIALVPLSTAGFIYYFIGNFVGGHIFLAGGLAAILGALLKPEKKQD
ncbi:MAG: hypothetical protein DMF29_06805 [Verrucomicrobia bacterium]|nr:MAG: hypothetical protein DMF29_06805 [Verrucomicrobiota bacterium]